MSRTVGRWGFALFFTVVIALVAVQASEAATLLVEAGASAPPQG